ncbi:MAG: hypothetical protein GYB64_04065 [Chloroflexi bacterium]|nr:hypothetical protein [Chloroflexota bacterium]
MSTVYTLSEATLAAIRRDLTRQLRISAAVALGIGLAIFGVMSILGMLTLPLRLLALAIYAAFMVIAGWYFHKVQRERWQLYRITLDEDTITREEGGRNTLIVHRDDITAIYEIPEGGILIRTDRRRKTIYVSNDLDDLPAIRERLAAWRDFDPLPR